MRLHAIVPGSLALALALASSAQQTPPTTFTARSDLVLVPVVVRDKSGAPVTGLQEQDFTLADGGKPQIIRSFEEVRDERTARPESARPGVFSNVGFAQPGEQRPTIILLDLLNPEWAQQVYARQQLLRYLEQSLDPGQPVALLTLTSGGLTVIHDFTRDPRVLIAALRRVRGQKEFAESPRDESVSLHLDQLEQETAELAEMMRNLMEQYSSDQRRLAGGITRDALRDLARSFAGVPGRKSLLWITSDIPSLLTDPRGFLNYDNSQLRAQEDTWRALNAASIAVYPVDLAGLVGETMQMQDSQASVGRRMGRRAPPTDLSGVYGGSADLHYQTIQNLMRMAAATGGHAYVERNDLAAALHEAERDSSSYYLLAFRPAEGPKPAWRKIAVKVKGHGLRVLARDTYLYVPPSGEASDSDRSELQQAMSSPLDYSAVPIELSWTGTISDGGPKRTINYEVGVHPNIDAGSRHFQVQIMTLVRTAQAEPLPPMSQTIEGTPSGDVLQHLQQDGLTYKNHLQLAPGQYNVRVVVEDHVSGRIGTLTVPLDVH